MSPPFSRLEQLLIRETNVSTLYFQEENIMSKILNGAKTIYYVVAAIATVISAVIMVVFFRHHSKIENIIDTAEDIAENVEDL